MIELGMWNDMILRR